MGGRPGGNLVMGNIGRGNWGQWGGKPGGLDGRVEFLMRFFSSSSTVGILGGWMGERGLGNKLRSECVSI